MSQKSIALARYRVYFPDTIIILSTENLEYPSTSLLCKHIIEILYVFDVFDRLLETKLDYARTSVSVLPSESLKDAMIPLLP